MRVAREAGNCAPRNMLGAARWRPGIRRGLRTAGGRRAAQAVRMAAPVVRRGGRGATGEAGASVAAAQGVRQVTEAQGETDR